MIRLFHAGAFAIGGFGGSRWRLRRRRNGTILTFADETNHRVLFGRCELQGHSYHFSFMVLDCGKEMLSLRRTLTRLSAVPCSVSPDPMGIVPNRNQNTNTARCLGGSFFIKLHVTSFIRPQ
jgi:hypothetical protein